jgi:hypothetical protein
MKITRALSRGEVIYLDPPDNSVLISINDVYGPHSAYIEDLTLKPWKDILWLSFDDVGAEEQHTMTDGQARQICDFVVLHGDRNIIVHCSGGISRSAGVCAFLEILGWEMRWLHRHQPNIHVKWTLLRAMGITPVGRAKRR